VNEKKSRKNYLEPPKAHRALADCEALEAILTHPEFPKISEPPPPKIQRKCPNCGKVVHRKGAKCPMYETNSLIE